MASNTFHTYSFELPCDLKITFLNNSVSRSKRHFEESEEKNHPEGKRYRHTDCYSLSSPHHRSSPANRVAPSPVSLLHSHGYYEDSNADDSLLEPLLGEGLDSPTGLSPEAEDRLLSESSVDGLEFGLSLQRVKNSQGFACIKFAQPSKSLEKTLSSEPLPLDGPSPCEEHAGNLSAGSPLGKGDFQTGTGLGFNSTLPPDAVQEADAFLNRQKGRDFSGVRDKEGAQVIGEKNAQAEGSVPTSEPELTEGSTSNALQSTDGESHTSSSQQETATSASSTVSDQRNSNSEDPIATEPNSPRRIFIHEADLEASKRKYINAVLDHADGRPVISEVNELHALIQWVGSENQGYSCQHTTDLTVRNYVQRSKRTNQRLSLPEWVEKNGGKLCRFASVPDHFQRSPIPS